MKTLTYTVTDPEGIHARPAGVLVKQAKEFSCAITLGRSGKTVDAKKLFGVMGMGVKCGEILEFSFDGEDESVAAEHFATTLPQTI